MTFLMNPICDRSIKELFRYNDFFCCIVCIEIDGQDSAVQFM